LLWYKDNFVHLLLLVQFVIVAIKRDAPSLVFTMSTLEFQGIEGLVHGYFTTIKARSLRGNSPLYNPQMFT